jgi:hypothetical protein
MQPSQNQAGDDWTVALLDVLVRRSSARWSKAVSSMTREITHSDAPVSGNSAATLELASVVQIAC